MKFYKTDWRDPSSVIVRLLGWLRGYTSWVHVAVETDHAHIHLTMGGVEVLDTDHPAFAALKDAPNVSITRFVPWYHIDELYKRASFLEEKPECRVTLSSLFCVGFNKKTRHSWTCVNFVAYLLGLSHYTTSTWTPKKLYEYLAYGKE